ncbi:MAG: protein kinase domain-containing protein [Micromonosporaceae bacterium]
MRGRRFADRYELQTPLGRGGMAEVWRAWDSRLERAVAVKILDQVGLADPGGVERFRREALAVARIAHPNIVGGYDFGTEDGRPYLVMELVAGQTLADRLAEGPLPIADVVRIATQTCDALQAAHQAGVVHRDIKPENLIMTAGGTVKVLDFGIARLQDTANQAALTRTQMVVGTSHFMAPEQATGGTADPRTDLYALGCVLYALLTGAPPFQGENPMSVLYQHLHHTARPIRESRPEVPAALDELVMGLLAKDPGGRPGSAAAVRAALDSHPDAGTGATAAAHGTGAYRSTPSGGTAAMPSAGGPVLAGRAAVPPPAAPATGVMHSAVPWPPPNGSRWMLGLAAAVVAVIVVAFLALALWPDSNPSAGSNPSPSTPPSSASPTPSPTEASPTATDPAGRLAELRGVLADQEATGEVDPEAANDLDRDLDEIAESIRDGDSDRAARKLGDFRDELDEQAREDRVSDSAYQELTAAADRLSEVLGQLGNGEDGEGEGRGKGKGNNDDKHEDGDD